ncbi:MFS general substrate transporter [Auriscalpium vulgare]|uniref:MFS general substrate transporter n=1 Tax=Auriscalpium vulgare TaxID=40419 RepID=A0ACB8SE64_9AGAM|nr:MFS general substrate transporter [Auriscalpium vulgare]
MSGSNSLRPSVSRSRVRAARSQSPPLLPAGLESLVFQDGGLDEETAEYIHEFVHPHHHDPDETFIEVDHDPTPDEEADERSIEDERAARSKLPWWKRPSPWWYIGLIPLTMAASMSTLAPRLEIITDIICDAQRNHSRNGQDSEGVPPSAFSGRGLLPFALSSPKDLDVPLAYGSTPVPQDSLLDLAFSGDDSSLPLTDKPLPCRSDPAVQATVALLLTIMSTTQGLLGLLTTAFWTAMADRHGRLFVMSINVSGLVIMDAIILAVIIRPSVVPGGYWGLVYAGMFEGLLGGRPTSIACISAYLSDCSDSATRSRVFSRFLGLMFTGMAIGPTLASFVIHMTGNVVSIFWIAVAIHVMFAAFNWFIIPESLLPTQKKIARTKYLVDSALKRQSRGAFTWLKGFYAFLTPLSVFAPTRYEEGATPHKARKRDWSLFWLAAAFAPETMIIGIAQYSFQYASGTFGWNSEMLGYWLSIVGISRALFLAVGLPALLDFLKPKSGNIRLPVAPLEPLNARSPSPPSADPGSSTGLRPPITPSHSHTSNQSRISAAKHTPAVDLAVARGSLAIQAFSFGVMGLLPMPWVFVSATVLGSLASGFSPTTHSLALELYTQKGGTESGKLFGAMSVLSAIGSQFIGPSLYGIVYIRTVAKLPEAIFFMSASIVLLSFAFICFIRLPNANGPGAEDRRETGQGQGETEPEGVPIIVVNEPQEPPRGRRLSKDVSDG